jgi:putative ABC transport system permease protein
VRVAGGTPLTLHRENLRDLAVQKIRETPGVEGLVRVKLRRSHFQGDEVGILGLDFAEHSHYSSLQLSAGEEGAVLDALASGQVVVTDVFVHRFGVGAGESLVLDTPQGKQIFRVAGVLRDYSPSPGVGMSIKRFDDLWPASPFRSVWVWTDADAETIVDRIRDRTAGIQSLTFLYGDAVENFGSRIFSRFSALFYLMAGIAAFGGTLAAANLLLSSVVERGAELKLLRVAGVVTRQLVVAVILDALLLGFVGAAIGIALAVVWVDPMLSVLGEALGWSIRYQSDWSYVLYVLAATSFLALAAGVYPAWRARRAPRDLEPLMD